MTQARQRQGQPAGGQFAYRRRLDAEIRELIIEEQELIAAADWAWDDWRRYGDWRDRLDADLLDADADAVAEEIDVLDEELWTFDRTVWPR